MDCFNQKSNTVRRKAAEKRKRALTGMDLQNLGIGSVSSKDVNLYKIDTFETSGLTGHIERLQKIAKINSVTYSKNTGISLWVKLNQ